MASFVNAQQMVTGLVVEQLGFHLELFPAHHCVLINCILTIIENLLSKLNKNNNTLGHIVSKAWILVQYIVLLLLLQADFKYI